MQYKPLDGRQVTASISGFKEYSTTRSAVPERPVPVLTPDELLLQIRTIQSVLNQQSVEKALKRLQDHIADENNPHHTDLDVFKNEISDVLYLEYQRLGGTGSKEFYLNCLFRVLRVATIEEMKDVANENLLVSIKGARDFIKQHESDPNAHADMFATIFPGDAPTYDPSFACYASIGISNYFVDTVVIESEEDTEADNSADICSYVGSDFRVHFCSYKEYDGIDYSLGTGTYACFGRRTNTIKNSNDFESLSKLAVTVNKTKDILNPAEGKGDVVVVRTGIDPADTLHAVYIPDMTIDNTSEYTYSVYAKAENCRYLAITWKDMLETDIEVKAIYDLEQGATMVVTDMTRYRSNIVALADGWYRCEFTLYHKIGQETDLNMVFFRQKDSDWSLRFKGENEICGYLWGMQMERGSCASPYIYTSGKERTRRAISYVIPLDAEWWEPSSSTLHIEWYNVGKYGTISHIRPVLTLADEAGYDVLTVDSRTDGSIELLRYSNIEIDGYGKLQTTIYQDIFQYNDSQWLQLTHGMDNTKIVTLFNDTKGLNLPSPAIWEGGSFLYLGSDSEGNSLDGYIRALVVYPRCATEEEAVFINGEEIYG